MVKGAGVRRLRVLGRLRTGAVLAALLLLGQGCAPQTRHAVLHFLIDGYPPYMTAEEKARSDAERVAREVALEEAAQARQLKRTRPVRKLARFTHGPFAAKECARCHDLGAASGFRGSRGGGALGAASADDLAEGGRLRMPVVELCVHCHTEYAVGDPRNEGLFMHGPVATGWCVLCHEPHSSDLPRLVRTAPQARLCGQCHLLRDLIAYTPEHRPSDGEESFPPAPGDESPGAEVGDDEQVVRVVRDCVRCHDPHRGSDRRLLRDVPLPAPVRDTGVQPVASGAPT